MDQLTLTGQDLRVSGQDLQDSDALWSEDGSQDYDVDGDFMVQASSDIKQNQPLIRKLEERRAKILQQMQQIGKSGREEKKLLALKQELTKIRFDTMELRHKRPGEQPPSNADINAEFVINAMFKEARDTLLNKRADLTAKKHDVDISGQDRKNIDASVKDLEKQLANVTKIEQNFNDKGYLTKNEKATLRALLKQHLTTLINIPQAKQKAPKTKQKAQALTNILKAKQKAQSTFFSIPDAPQGHKYVCRLEPKKNQIVLNMQQKTPPRRHIVPNMVTVDVKPKQVLQKQKTPPRRRIVPNMVTADVKPKQVLQKQNTPPRRRIVPNMVTTDVKRNQAFQQQKRFQPETLQAIKIALSPKRDVEYLHKRYEEAGKMKRNDSVEKRLIEIGQRLVQRMVNKTDKARYNIASKEQMITLAKCYKKFMPRKTQKAAPRKTQKASLSPVRVGRPLRNYITSSSSSMFD